MGVATSHFCLGSLSARQLGLREISLKPGLPHGFAGVSFGICFFVPGECFFIQPDHGVVNVKYVVRRLCIFLREQGIELLAQAFGCSVRLRAAKSLGEFRLWRNTMIGGERHPDVG